MIVTKKHVFFFKDWLSNFTYAPFFILTNKHGYQNFKTSEQAFMFFKAETFEDEAICNKIVKAETPQQAKTLGRLVSNYRDDIWSTLRFTVMYSCNYHKYDQNKNLFLKLKNPEFDGLTFAEASPFDKIWGIGLDANKVSLDYLDNEDNWYGENLMGKVITSVRRDLIEHYQKCK